MTIFVLLVATTALWALAGIWLRSISWHIPGYSDSHNIASMDIQCNVGDASDLQSGGGVVGASKS